MTPEEARVIRDRLQSYLDMSKWVGIPRKPGGTIGLLPESVETLVRLCDALEESRAQADHWGQEATTWCAAHEAAEKDLEEARAELRRERAEHWSWKRLAELANERATDAESLAREAMAALEPLAELADHYRQDGPDHLPIYDINEDEILTLGDCRNARATLAKLAKITEGK